MLPVAPSLRGLGLARPSGAALRNRWSEGREVRGGAFSFILRLAEAQRGQYYFFFGFLEAAVFSPFGKMFQVLNIPAA